MNRRSFLSYLTSTILGLFATSRCGSSSSSSSATPTGNCANGGTVSYSNPGHAHTTIALTAAQITAAAPGNYTLMGGGHSHTFTLTASNFSTISGGGTVSKTDLEGDGHVIRIAC